MIDGASRAVTATVPVDRVSAVGGLAVDPGDRTLYVLTEGSPRDPGSVAVIDTSTLTVAATVTVGRRPRGVAVDPGAHVAYVTNEDDGTVSVIETQ